MQYQYTADQSAQQIIDSIAGNDPKARRSGDGWKVVCPVHGGADSDANVYIGVGDKDGVVCHCHVNTCPADYKDLLEAFGIEPRFREPNYQTTYSHRDGKNRNVYRGKNKKIYGKGSSQGCELKIWNPFDTPDHMIIIVEGEPAAQALHSHDFKGVSVASWRGGCKVAQYVDATPVKDRNVILWPDDDSHGRKAMEELAAVCWDYGASAIKIIPTDGETTKDAANYERKEILSILKTKQPVEHDPGWQETTKGAIVSSSVLNAMKAIQEVTRTVQFDEFSGLVEIDGDPITDTTVSLLRAEIERRCDYIPGRDAVKAGIDNLAHRNRYDSMLDWMKSLTWDGVDRLDHMATRYFGYPANDYAPYMNAVAALLVRGMVSRQFKPGEQYDYCVILRSEREGTGKSSALRILSGGSDFYCGSFALDSYDMTKTTLEKSAGKLLVVSEELAGQKRSETEKVKGIITETSDTSRLAYGLHRVTVDRRFIFAATTNETYIIPGPNSVRRYPVLEVNEVDLPALQTDRDQIFAEAVATRVPGPVSLTPEFRTMQRGLASHYMKTSELEEWFTDTMDLLKTIHGDRPLAIQGTVLRAEAKRHVTRIIDVEYSNLLRRFGFQKKMIKTDDGFTRLKAWVQKGKNPVLIKSEDFA